MHEHEYTIADLLRVMQRLRDPQTGCPWDICQDFHSIVPSTLEECYELVDAIERNDYPHVAEELGDVLFQVIFYAQLGEESALFSFAEVVNNLVEKLLRRHPHVFADGKIEGVVSERSSVAEVKSSWEEIKQSERRSRQEGGILADIPHALPALPRAQKIQKRAAGVNFDWNDVADVIIRLEQEIEELRSAIAAGTAAEIADEMGDVLYSCVNVSRHLSLDAESTLRRSTSKFEKRFRQMEAAATRSGLALIDMNNDQLDELWEQAKGS
ncbi:MAG: nucleoside triphosphate pyrophosphohydrolase [Halieaceae bacterium]|nr:nucleoside triphosphate pyrophosphohydrolase [Halieaceae bacterium]MCP4842756.1 nucleoside triphosphate pyrophosphohydrolase [Halieaceae bacterium]MDG2412143.1 nucleoside triphosphate pyrophosphohydrolase [Halioglobus sp.]